MMSYSDKIIEILIEKVRSLAADISLRECEIKALERKLAEYTGKPVPANRE